DKEGLVTCLDESRHGLEDGDFVTFTEVQGMTELNVCSPRKVTVGGPYTFTIGDTSDLGEFVRGGIFTQVKMPKILQFCLSRPRNAKYSASLVALVKKIDADADEKIITELVYQATGDLPPVAAVIGGFVAQEVLKACSAKFYPMLQHLYFDSLESLPTTLPNEQDCQPLGSRYDGQIAVFGKPFQDKLANHRQFFVGAGAIGMMGLATGPDATIHVTDLDTIEKSNLNRQFLFHAKDLGKFKSEVAAAAVADMNPALKGHIPCRQDPVGQATENVFDDDFFAGLDGVTNALDNVAARVYMDQRCILYEKPLLESGTMGMKGNTQVVIPHLTESYSSSQDPPEKQTLSCTVKNFPNAITHTIEFDAMFVKPVESVNQYLSEPNYLENSLKYSGQSHDHIFQIVSYLVTNKPLTFEECIIWARLQFEEKFNNAIRQLLHSLPKDHVTSTGQPFWSGPKRAPDPLPTHLSFIIAAANLHAYNYGLRGETDPAVFKRVADSVIIPEFSPKSGVKIQITENDPVNQSSSDHDNVSDQVKKLPAPSSLAGYRLTPVEFEKDDDTNHHIDLITAASNLHAMNYNITVADRHNTKQIAGKIIPAIATTTALVVGLVCLELYKIIDGKNKLDDFKNRFINLALPFFGFSEPIAAAKNKFENTEWTLWDRLQFKNDPTLKEFIAWFKTHHNLDVSMVSQGVSMLWSSFTDKKKSTERMPMEFSKLVEHVSKKPIPLHTKHLLVEFPFLIFADHSDPLA
ncbi:hypothetical protein EDB19DRAFT_1719833, partial [Suillus lakei]